MTEGTGSMLVVDMAEQALALSPLVVYSLLPKLLLTVLCSIVRISRSNRIPQGRIIPGAYKFNVIITTYEVLLAPQCELRNIQWRLCIIDEAHRLKNRNCKILEELKHIHTVS